MEIETRKLYTAWKAFVNNQPVPTGHVRQKILDSWERCQASRVDSSKGIGNYQHPNVKKLMLENQPLSKVALPVMKDILDLVEGSGFAIVLASAAGYVLEVVAEKEMMSKMKELSFLPGYLWTEATVGTNAIGTAIYLDEPIQTIGAEHYGQCQHGWTCSAAPIHDANGKLIGCIDMSGDREKAHSHTLGIVKVAAQSIEKQLALLHSHQMMQTTLESILEGVIVLDTSFHLIMTNQKSLELLGVSETELCEYPFAEMKGLFYSDLNKQHRFEWQFKFDRRSIKVMVSVAPYGEKQGWVITLNEPKKMHKWANQLVGFTANYTFESIVTQSANMAYLIKHAQKAAASYCNVLIEGESGTGKELLAQSIHNAGVNNEGPFVAVNCASIPRELVESELFGYEKGAFTGASKEGHPGKFELADGGTIFLDEIGELPLDIQSKLLRVLDNSRVIRIGGTEEKQLDIRVIGATNRILEEEIKLKNFRADLYYRLSVMKLHIPPLRERTEDIELLVNHFVQMLNEKNKGKKKIKLAYIAILRKLPWAGNIRELRNVVERDYYLSDTVIEHHPMQIERPKPLEVEAFYLEAEEKTSLNLAEAERLIIEATIQQTAGNLAEAARRLEMGRTTLYRKIKKYQINVPK